MNDPKSGKAPFLFPVRVRFADTDLQGHVFFANYFTYCDEGLMAYLDHIGYSWQKMGTMGLELYYVESSCQFKGSALFGDLLKVETRILEIGTSSMTSGMTIFKTNREQIVAMGRITAVMVSTETGKPTPIPAELREAISIHSDMQSSE